MTYREFYHKIQTSVTPDKNFISAQTLGEGLTCETLENMKVAAFLNVKCRIDFDDVTWKHLISTFRSDCGHFETYAGIPKADSGVVQAAAVQKGIEVAGQLVDKQLQIIDEAQEKAAEFLEKGVRCSKYFCHYLVA